MKKNKKPTVSQYSYMVTGLLSAKLQMAGIITKDDVKETVETAKMAYDLITDAIGDIDEDEDDCDREPRMKNIKEPMPNYFDKYIWEDGIATWSELANWLKKQGVTSNRRISNIFRESLEKGYIRKDETTHKYLPPLP